MITKMGNVVQNIEYLRILVTSYGVNIWDHRIRVINNICQTAVYKEQKLHQYHFQHRFVFRHFLCMIHVLFTTLLWICNDMQASPNLYWTSFHKLSLVNLYKIVRIWSTKAKWSKRLYLEYKPQFRAGINNKVGNL